MPAWRGAGTMPALVRLRTMGGVPRCRVAHHRSGRRLVRLRHPARRAAAGQCAGGADRLQDRHLLRLPRCLGGRLRPAIHRSASGLGGRTGRRCRVLSGGIVAAPILFDAYGRLGANPKPLPMPPFTLQATTATLPPPLRHVRHDVPKTIASTIQAPLQDRVSARRIARRPRTVASDARAREPRPQGIRRCAASDLDGRRRAGGDRLACAGRLLAIRKEPASSACP